jgi:HSP20 family protein
MSWKGRRKETTMSTSTRLLPASFVPFDWPHLSWFPTVPSTLRIEESVDEQLYTLRAEIPGIDPAKDVTVVYHDGTLRLEIHRSDVRKDKTHTEFHYGNYGRTVTLPEGVVEESIHATYRDGILEITAKVAAPVEAYKTIPVTTEMPKHPANGKH